jgi:hypothetical protein
MQHRFLLVPKSRQMTITWLFCALYLWESMFYPSRLTFFQSKKEEDAKANIKRTTTMYQRFPEWMKNWQPLKLTEITMNFPRSRSEIRGIPQGADHVRGFTSTGIFVDEACFVEELDQTLAAAKPSLGKLGKFTAVSSASPSIFKSMCYDEQRV